MTPQDFTTWLNGFVEINGKLPTSEQWKIIVEKLQSVFQKETKLTNFSFDVITVPTKPVGTVLDCSVLEKPFSNWYYGVVPESESGDNKDDSKCEKCNAIGKKRYLGDLKNPTCYGIYCDEHDPKYLC
jgi:hypothetical protein